MLNRLPLPPPHRHLQRTDWRFLFWTLPSLELRVLRGAGPLVLLAFLIACGELAPSQSSPVIEGPEDKSIFVETANLVPETLEVEVALTGQFEAESEVVIRSELEGRDSDHRI